MLVACCVSRGDALDAVRQARSCLRRYLVAAHLVTKGKPDSSLGKWQAQLEQLRRIIVNEEYQYSDPVTDFVKAVYCDYDFDRAQVCARPYSVLSQASA